MNKTNFNDLFDHIESLSVGFGPIFRGFTETSNYPPHNIVKMSDNKFYIELAVSGFKKHEIVIEEDQGLVTIKANKDGNELAPTDSYQYRGIAKRSFSKKFQIAEYFEISNASLEDGLLVVTFVKNAPEESKPKLIAIN